MGKDHPGALTAPKSSSQFRGEKMSQERNFPLPHSSHSLGAGNSQQLSKALGSPGPTTVLHSPTPGGSPATLMMGFLGPMVHKWFLA